METERLTVFNKCRYAGLFFPTRCSYPRLVSAQSWLECAIAWEELITPCSLQKFSPVLESGMSGYGYVFPALRAQYCSWSQRFRHVIWGVVLYFSMTTLEVTFSLIAHSVWFLIFILFILLVVSQALCFAGFAALRITLHYFFLFSFSLLLICGVAILLTF